MKIENLEFEPPNECLGLEPDLFVKAIEGNAFAQLDIGKAYFDAPQVKDNLITAFKWIKQAAQQQNSEAHFKLGDLYAFGQGVEMDEFTAYNWYLKSAIQGYPKALTRIHNLYHIESSMYCRGKRDAGEDEWATADFKKKNKIRELNEYRIEQMKPMLTKIKEFFSDVLNTCRNQIKEEIQDKKDVYSTLGFLYQHGYGIRKITSRAIEFYKLAAEQGSADAAYNLGYIYHQNYRWKWNYREAFKWYTIAAKHRNSTAQESLAFLYLKGLGTDINYLEALRWYTKAAESRNINAMISLASIYRKGDIAKQDYTKVLEWYKKAIKEGSTVAQNSLESLYHGKNISVTDSGPKVYSKKGLCSKLSSDISNVPESADLENLKKLVTHCKRGDGHAMFDIGKRYSQGNELPQDKYIAFKWIKNAAKAGLNEARRQVAQMYKDGGGIGQDYHKASTWYMRAAKSLDDKAQYELGLLYYHGLGVRKDPLEASRWFTFAAEKNNSDAQCQLGVLRERGEGLSQDTDEAVKLYNEAVKQKNSQAIYKLGQMHEIRGGLETNVELSMKLFKIAARLGSLDAQLRLAEIYDDDYENPYYDTKKSFKYYRMAADKGNPYAKYKLAIMYLDGQGTSQDLIQAYYLFKESSNLGYGNAINIFNIPIDYSKSDDIDYRNVVVMLVTVCKKEIDSLEYNVGHIYSQTFFFDDNSMLRPFTENLFLSRSWYKRAASKGNPLALYKLGIYYENKNKSTRKQDFSKAIEYFQRAYVMGSHDATYKLAYMYLYDYGVSQDLKKAFTLLNEASDMGNKEAYGTLNSFDSDDEEDKNEAVMKMLEMAAGSGHVISQYNLGILTSDTKSPYYNIKEAIKWLEMASNGGFINAHYQLGLLIEPDNISEGEQKKVISLYRMAGEKGHEQALFRLAHIYQNGAKRDYVEALRLYTLAAQQGYQPAQLATYVSSGLVWEEKKNQLHDNFMLGGLEYQSCLRMWEAVSDQGNIELQFNLGMMHEEVGTDSSLPKAARWYSRAAECSHTSAIYHLGRLYETGRGVHQDYLQAIKYYKIACDFGNSDALYQLGTIYQHGKGTRADSNKAIDYYTQAAEKGNTMAQFTLGQFFEEGKLLSKNILEAVKWYSISNSQEEDDIAHNWLYNNYDEAYSSGVFYKRLFHIHSQIVKINSRKDRHQNNELLGEVNCKLGLMYLYGYGTKLDYKEALKYFRKSIKLCDNDKARLFSEIIYEDIPATLTEEYLKKVAMFETTINQLDLEDIYELGLIYYHGVNSISGENGTNETRVIIKPDPVKSSKYFRMIVKGQLSDDELYTSSSYYLGMMHFIDVEYMNDTRKATYYLTNVSHGGFSDAEALLSYINKEEIDKEVIFKRVFDWHMDNQNKHRLKITFNIGWMYFKGFGTDQDYAKALYYVGISADQNYTDAQTLLGILYQNGYGIDQDWAKAREWYSKAANQNNAIANNNMGNIYYHGNGVEVNFKLAFQYCQTAANQGLDDAQFNLGSFYVHGYGTDQNWTKAIEWYTKAANQDNLFAHLSLGNIYLGSAGFKADYQLAFQHYQTAADQGHAGAQLKLGDFYNDGYGTDQNWTKAVEWYTKAENQGDIVAHYKLGGMCLYGEGVEVDYQLAFQHYQTAADRGHTNAQSQLAYMYHRGLGVERDDGKAIQLCSSIANNNNYTWCLSGEIYHSADIQFQNFPKALECYEQTEGRAEGYTLRGLGLLYEHGDGVDKNYEKAFEYYMLSQMEGNKGACYNIALLYYYGKGIVQNLFAALEYFERVLEAKCEKDATYVLVESDIESNSCFDQQKKKYSFVPERIIYGEAHYCLGIMNEKGQGTCQDHEKALYHFKRSHSYGIDRAKKFLELQ